MRVQYKLFIITLLGSLTLVTSMLLLAQWSFDRGLLEHVNERALKQYQTLSVKLQEHYQKEGGWQKLQQPLHSKSSAQIQYFWLQLQHDSGIDIEPRELQRAREDAGRGQQPFSQNRDRQRPRPGLRREYRDEFRHERNNRHERGSQRRPERSNERRFNRPEDERSNRPPPFPEQRLNQAQQPPAQRPRPRPPKSEPLALVNVDKELVIGFLAKPEHRKFLPIKTGIKGQPEKIMGYLVYANRERLLDDYELSLSSQLSQNLWWIAGLMILLSGLLALPFSQLLLRPLRPIVSAIHLLAKGKLDQQVEIESKDEIGRVAEDVNHLAQKLRETDQTRKAWLANISHELRTPLAVMRGELEAMQDGIRELNKENLNSAHQEALHLQRLVEDLYQLASSELGEDDVAAMSYQKQDLNIVELLEEDLERFKPLMTKAGLDFHFDNHIQQNELIEEGLWVNGDANRLSQLVHNLINNSIKYTHAPGKIVADLWLKNDVIIFSISDSAPCVKESELSKIFDHLYRAEQSRNRKTGGSGLGLAICEKIASSHGGELTAQLSKMGGITMTLCLPRSN